MPEVTAQNADNKKFFSSVLGGINFTNFSGNDINGIKLSNSMILGYHIGYNIQVPIVKKLYFSSGILMKTKGSRYNGSLLYGYRYRAKSTYVELPLNFVYKGLAGAGNYMVGFGPYLGYAVTQSGENNKAFDAGINIFAGYEFPGGIYCQVYKENGMVNIASSAFTIYTGHKSEVKNKGFGFSLGYRF